MKTPIVGSLFSVLATVLATHVSASGAGAQNPPAARGQQGVIIRVTRDSIVMPPSVNENMLILEKFVMLERISGALREMDIEMRGPNPVSLERNASTFQGLQKSLEDIFVSIESTCAGPNVSRPAWLGVDLLVRSEQRPNLEVVTDYPTVIRVVRGSPASIAGVLPDDQIVAVDEVDVRGKRLEEFIQQPGKRITLTLSRAGVFRKVRPVLDSGKASVPVTCEFVRSSPTLKFVRSADSALSHSFKINPMQVKQVIIRGGTIKDSGLERKPSQAMVTVMSHRPIETLFGAHMTTATQQRATAPVPANIGVRVLIVMANSQADRGGLKAGDVVTSVGKKRITAVSELKSRVEEIAATKRSSVDVEVLRDSKVVPLSIPW